MLWLASAWPTYRAPAAQDCTQIGKGERETSLLKNLLEVAHHGRVRKAFLRIEAQPLAAYPA